MAEDAKVVEVPPLLLRRKDTAARIGCGVPTLDGWRQQGRGPEWLVVEGVGVRYELAEVDRWVREHSERRGVSLSHSRQRASDE